MSDLQNAIKKVEQLAVMPDDAMDSYPLLSSAEAQALITNYNQQDANLTRLKQENETLRTRITSIRDVVQCMT